MGLSQVLLVVLCSFLGLYCLDFKIGGQKKRQTTLEGFDNTCGLRNLSVIFRYTSLQTVGNKLVLNSSITVRRILPKDLTLVIETQRCKNKENLDTCERFYNHKSDKFCTLIETDTLWTPEFAAYEPPFKCPFKTITYKAINGTIDVAAFLLFPVDSWYWRLKFELRDTNNLDNIFMCCKAEAHFATV